MFFFSVYMWLVRSCCYCAAGGQGGVWPCRDRNKAEMGRKDREKAIKAYLSPGIFMTSSYEEVGVSVVSCFDSFNFAIYSSFCLFSL